MGLAITSLCSKRKEHVYYDRKIIQTHNGQWWDKAGVLPEKGVCGQEFSAFSASVSGEVMNPLILPFSKVIRWFQVYILIKSKLALFYSVQQINLAYRSAFSWNHMSGLQSCVAFFHIPHILVTSCFRKELNMSMGWYQCMSFYSVRLLKMLNIFVIKNIHLINTVLNGWIVMFSLAIKS